MSTLNKRIWWVVGALVSMLLTAVVLMMIDARRSAEPSAPAKPALATLVAPAQPPLKPLPVLGSISPAASAGQPVSGDDGLAICGAAAMKVVRGEPAQALDQRAEAAFGKLSPPPWEAMQRSSDDLTRAAGHAVLGSVTAVIKLATATRDPQVHVLAQRLCSRQPPTEANGDATTNAWCGMLPARQWAQLEPDNAAAWMAVAAEAHRRNDASEVDEALSRATRASQLNQHAMVLTQALDKHLARPNGDSNPSPWLIKARSSDGAVVSSIAAAPALCTAKAMARADRREVCSDVSVFLMDKASTPEDMAWGLAIAEALGDDSEATAKRRQLHEAVTAAAAERLFAGPSLASCDNLRLVQQWSRSAAKGQSWSWLRDQAIAQAGSQTALLKWYEETSAATQRKLAASEPSGLPTAGNAPSAPVMAEPAAVAQR